MDVAASPPACPRDAIERMNTPSSAAYACIRTRSPSSAPPVIGDDGSTATTATVRPAVRELRDERGDERRLARAGRPGDPDEVRAAGQRVEAAQRGLGDGRAVLDGGQQPGERAPVAGAGGVGQGGGALRDGVSAIGPAASRAGVALARMKSATSPIVVPGPKTAATPASRSGGTSSSGMIPPTVTRTSSRPRSRSCALTRGHERHVGAGQDRQADDVDVLLERGGHDHLGRLAEARVDDLEALVAQAAGEHLGAAVVAVEAGLRDQHLERSVGHARDCRRAAQGAADRRWAR